MTGKAASKVKSKISTSRTDEEKSALKSGKKNGIFEGEDFF